MLQDDSSDRAVRWHKEPLVGLEAKAAPSHTAVIVVDMQNDFCAQDGMMWHEGRDLSAVQAMADRLPAFLGAARSAGALVVFVRNVYSTELNWYLSDVWLEQATRRRHGSYTERKVCAPDSWNLEFYGGVRPASGDPVVTKHRFGAFMDTDLEVILRSNAIRTLVMTGAATNVCVETTAREGFMRDYYILFAHDGTATYTTEAHEATLKTIDSFFGEVVSLKDLVSVWAKSQQLQASSRVALPSTAADDPGAAVGSSKREVT